MSIAIPSKLMMSSANLKTRKVFFNHKAKNFENYIQEIISVIQLAKGSYLIVVRAYRMSTWKYSLAQ